MLCLIVVRPLGAGQGLALPIAARLYSNRQGLTKGKKGKGKSSGTGSGVEAKTGFQSSHASGIVPG